MEFLYFILIFCVCIWPTISDCVYDNGGRKLLITGLKSVKALSYVNNICFEDRVQEIQYKHCDLNIALSPKLFEKFRNLKVISWECKGVCIYHSPLSFKVRGKCLTGKKNINYVCVFFFLVRLESEHIYEDFNLEKYFPINKPVRT